MPNCSVSWSEKMLPLTLAEQIAFRNSLCQDSFMMFYAFPAIVAHFHHATVASPQAQRHCFPAGNSALNVVTLSGILIHHCSVLFVFMCIHRGISFHAWPVHQSNSEALHIQKCMQTEGREGGWLPQGSVAFSYTCPVCCSFCCAWRREWSWLTTTCYIICSQVKICYISYIRDLFHLVDLFI